MIHGALFFMTFGWRVEAKLLLLISIAFLAAIFWKRREVVHEIEEFLDPEPKECVIIPFSKYRAALPVRGFLRGN